MKRIVAVCGSGLGSSFIVELNIKEICKINNWTANVTHVNLGSFDKNATDILVCALDLADSIDFHPKIVLKNLIDKEEIKEKLAPFFNE